MPGETVPDSVAHPRLLVVDDEPAVLKLVKTMLVRANYDITTCGSGTEALRLMEDNSFDCIITDAVMPVMTGYDLVKAIRKHPLQGQLPVLMLTRKRHRQDVKKAVEVGVTDYVLKPIDEHLLLDKVELCVRKGMGKRHLLEVSLSGTEAQARLSFGARIASISEADITIRVPVRLSADDPFNFEIPIFDELGITPPLMNLLSCEPVREGGNDPVSYEAKITFAGVPESDLRKLRAWIQKEGIRRRK